MKTLFESILSSTTTGKAAIDAMYMKYGLNPSKVKTNDDGTIDYDGDIDFESKRMPGGKLPFKFNVVNGTFYVANSGLKTMEGFPRVINGNMYAEENNFTDLKGGPEKVTGLYDVAHCQLTSLDGFCKNWPDIIRIYDNRLKSLKGLPSSKGSKCRGFSCNDNELTSLEGCPERVDGEFACSHNKLVSFEGGPKEAQIYGASNQRGVTPDPMTIKLDSKISGLLSVTVPLTGTMTRRNKETQDYVRRLKQSLCGMHCQVFIDYAQA